MYLFLLIFFVFVFFTFSQRKKIIQRRFDIHIINVCQFLLSISIVLAHLSQYLKTPWLRAFTTCGCWAVPIFFLISGYGLLYSMTQKKNYLKGFLYKRLGKVLMPFVISSLIYLLLFWSNGCDLHLRSFVLHDLSLFTLPYSWFVLSITCFYVIFYLSFWFFKNTATALSIVFLGVLVYEIHRWHSGCIPNTFFSGLCFPLGMVLYRYEQHFERIVCRSNRIVLVIAVIICSMVALGTYSSFGKIYAALMFYLLVRITPGNNSVLSFAYHSIEKLKLNLISYEVYLTQGIAFLALRSNYIYISSTLTYTIACVILTMVISGGVYFIKVHINKFLRI